MGIYIYIYTHIYKDGKDGRKNSVWQDFEDFMNRFWTSYKTKFVCLVVTLKRTSPTTWEHKRKCWTILGTLIWNVSSGFLWKFTASYILSVHN